VAITCTVFLCVFAGALLGMLLRKVLPDYYSSAEPKDIVRLGTGLIATTSAVVLGLLIGSAQNSMLKR
jgi:fluoride ion exporter CrcB/FEX